MNDPAADNSNRHVSPEDIQETIRKSRELIAQAQQRIDETRAQCAELGLTPEQLADFDVQRIEGLPPELKRLLIEEQERWEREVSELKDSLHPTTPDQQRAERLDKLGHLRHPYRL